MCACVNVCVGSAVNAARTDNGIKHTCVKRARGERERESERAGKG